MSHEDPPIVHVEQWSTENSEPMTLETITLKHQPSSRFMVAQEREILPGMSFTEASRSALCYILCGSCTYEIGGQTIELKSGESIRYTTGSFRVSSREGCVRVRVVDRLAGRTEAPAARSELDPDEG